MSSRRRRTKDDDVTQIQYIQKRLDAEKRIKRRIKRKRLLKRLSRLVIIILVIVGLYLFDQSKYSRVRSIEVEGNNVLSETVLLESLDLKENDRLLKAFFKKLTLKSKIPGVAKQSLKLYYTKGLINLTVEEYPVVAMLSDAPKRYLLSDNHVLESNENLDNPVPILKKFNTEIFEKYPEFSEKLSKIDQSSFNSISEIELVDEPLEKIYFKFTMNHGYFVFTNLDNLLLMDYYPDIVSGIQKGDKKDNRCIYFLDYGHTDENQSAVAKPCEKDE